MPTPDELFQKWTPWAVKISRLYSEFVPKGQLFEKQLENAALFGLWDACNKFDDSLGFRFTTYARLRIKGAIRDELRDNDILPRRTRMSGPWPMFFTLDVARQFDGVELTEIRDSGDFLLCAIRSLRGKQRQFAELRWFCGLKLKQIGLLWGLSEGRVGQIHRDVLERLKAWAEKQRCE